jgi:hypothetical protein
MRHDHYPAPRSEEALVPESLVSSHSSLVHAVTVLATALDELGARIYRDLHIESGHIDVTGSPRLAATLTDFSAYADECLSALDDPMVTKALAAARSPLT